MWFRVNGLLPDGLQKSLPDRPPEMLQADMHEGLPKSANKSSPMPRRSPPPPPTAVESSRNAVASSGAVGAFWTTQHAKDSAVVEEVNKVKFDEESTGPEWSREEMFSSHKTSPAKYEDFHSRPSQKSMQGKSGPSKDFELNLFQDGVNEKSSDGFNAFATEFGVNKVSPGRSSVNMRKEEQLEAEVEKLREQLKHVNMEKSELSSKYEKLSAICRSQRQELHELKQTLASTTPSPSKTSSQSHPSPGIQNQSPSQQKEGTIWELQKGLFDNASPSSDQKSWQAFPEDTTPTTNRKSVRTRNGHQNKQTAGEADSGANTSWGFGAESFTAVPAASPQVNTSTASLNHSQRLGESKNKESKSGSSQPAGWAGF